MSRKKHIWDLPSEFWKNPTVITVKDKDGKVKNAMDLAGEIKITAREGDLIIVRSYHYYDMVKQGIIKEEPRMNEP